MKAEFRTVTPELAQHLLDMYNKDNRPLNAKHVDFLAKEMIGGRWRVNGDTISIGDEGRIIDGQHRLSAVVKSGCTIQCLFVYGLKNDVFNTKDIGKRRSSGDTLSVMGEKNAHSLAAALSLIDMYYAGKVCSRTPYSNTEIEGLLKKYPDARSSILTQDAGGHKCILQPSVMHACHYIFKMRDPDLADDFFERLVKGVRISEGTPIYALRSRLLANIMSKAKLSKAYIMALCIKAWNAERAGKNIKTLRWTEDGDGAEHFPVAI